MQVLPDVAVFGEKDYQQLQVIRRLVRDLDIPVEVIGGPTIRETDGLAMSSRNAYLSKEHRAVAPSMKRIIDDAGKQVLAGGDPQATEDAAGAALLAAGFEKIDYVAIRNADSLAKVSQAEVKEGSPLRVLAAAHLGTTRLIDNVNPRANN